MFYCKKTICILTTIRSLFLSRTPKVVCPGPRLSTCSNKNHLKTIVDDIFYCLSTQLHASMITTWSLEWLKKGIFTYSSVCRPYFIHEIVGRIQYFRKEESSASYSYKSLLEPPLHSYRTPVYIPIPFLDTRRLPYRGTWKRIRRLSHDAVLWSTPPFFWNRQWDWNRIIPHSLSISR